MRVAVGVGVHQDGAARLPVAARAPDLLVIRFQASRQRGVDHGADVGLIDAHAEGDGGDHHLDLPARNSSCTRLRCSASSPA